MEKDTIFSSSISYNGIFKFSEFYLFCYQWLTEETGLDISEDTYKETIKGSAKDVKVEWTGTKKITDYFKFEVKVVFEIVSMSEVEIQKAGEKIKTNKGKIKIKAKGNLVKDYEGKFEKDALRKFLRSIYEKWIITSRIRQFEEKLFEECDEFMNQTKAFLALEGEK